MELVLLPLGFLHPPSQMQDFVKVQLRAAFPGEYPKLAKRGDIELAFSWVHEAAHRYYDRFVRVLARC